MKTNQIMVRPMGQFKVEQRTKDSFFNASALMKQWNEVTNSKKSINHYLDLVSTKEFFDAIIEDDPEIRDAEKPINHILGKSRKQPIVEARQMAMYIYRFRAKYRVIHIAELFHRKYPTVVSALGHLQSLLDVDDKVSDKHKRIMDALWVED